LVVAKKIFFFGKFFGAKFFFLKANAQKISTTKISYDEAGTAADEGKEAFSNLQTA